MKKYVITGAGGFIGGALAKKLLSAGNIVYVVDINTEILKKFDNYNNCRKIILNFKEYNNLHSYINEEIDVFYHFAWEGGFTDAIRDYKLQLDNAKYAVDAILQAIKIECKRFVYSGTYNEYEILTLLKEPLLPPRYTTIYSSAKTVADLMCKTIACNNNVEYCSGLIPMPYGEGNYSKQLTNVVVDSLNKGISPKLVEGNNLYDLVYIDDITEAFVAIGEKGINLKSYYVGNRKLKTFKELMCEIRDIISPSTELRFGEYKDNQSIDYTLIDLEELYKDTGFECKSDFKENIKKTSSWVKLLNL